MARRFYPHQLQPNPDLLGGQFILCQADALLPSSWQSQTHGRWNLGWSAPLTCASIKGPHGRTMAWILGHAVTADGRYLRPDSGLQSEVMTQGCKPLSMASADGFIAIDLTSEDPRIQVDIHGMLGAVYAPDQSCVASTAMLIPVSPKTPFDVERILECGIPYRTAMYPLGFTPRRGIERILPNHILDLGSWRAGLALALFLL